MSSFDLHRRRLELQEILEECLGDQLIKTPDGGTNVYFQPPISVKMHYPAIVYERSRVNKRHANNSVYRKMVAYQVTVISKDPDNDICDKVDDLPHCTYDRRFVTDNLYHDTFTIYY